MEDPTKPSLEELARRRNRARQAFAATCDATARANDGVIVTGPNMPGWAEYDAATKALDAALDAIGA